MDHWTKVDNKKSNTPIILNNKLTPNVKPMKHNSRLFSNDNKHDWCRCQSLGFVGGPHINQIIFFGKPNIPQRRYRLNGVLSFGLYFNREIKICSTFNFVECNRFGGHMQEEGFSSLKRRQRKTSSFPTKQQRNTAKMYKLLKE
jgi:hypothetical protein